MIDNGTGLDRGVSFTFVLNEISRENYGKVKDDFVANIEVSLPWHPVNGNV